MIKNIVFDLGNVIAKFDPYDIYHRFTNSKEEALALYDYLYESGLWVNLDRGHELDEVITQIQKNAPQHYHKAIERIIYEWIDALEVDPQMETLIHDLKNSHYQIYLLSNISKQFYAFKEKNSVFTVFDGIYISADSKLIKPDQEIYLDFLNKFNLLPHESVFIDDKLENIEGAQLSGLHIYHYQNDIEQLKSYLQDDLEISFETR